MAWSLIAAGIVGDTSPGNHTITVGPLNCTGADLFVAIASNYNAAADVRISDDASNTYSTQDKDQGSGGDSSVRCTTRHVFSPTVNSAITFSAYGFPAGTPEFTSLAIYAFSGLAASPTVTAVGSGAGTTSAQAGSIGVANDLVIAGLSWYTNNTMSIDSGFATPQQVGYSAGACLGLATSWLEVSGAVNPTWSWSGSNAPSAIALAFPGTGAAAATVKRLAALGVG